MMKNERYNVCCSRVAKCLDTVDCDDLSVAGTEFVNQQDHWHHYHEGQQTDTEDINNNGLIFQIPVSGPIHMK